MTTLALHQHPDAWEFRRYGAAALAIVALHIALIGAAFVWYKRAEPQGVTIPAILVDLAPAPAAQQVQTVEDVAPGPEMQQADAPPPEPPKPELIEQIPPTPVQPEPVVAAPPKVEPKPQPKPIKPQPVREEAKKPTPKPPAPRTSAPQKAERVARETPAATSGASAAAAAASYRAILVAHLQRFKQFPSGAGAADSGVVYVRFTVTRNGRVTSSGLSRSSGFPALDQAGIALLQRAQPLPPFPPEMRQASESFTAPLNYVRR